MRTIRACSRLRQFVADAEHMAAVRLQEAAGVGQHIVDGRVQLPRGHVREAAGCRREELFECQPVVQGVFGPLPIGDVADDMHRAGQISRCVQYGVNGHLEVPVADGQFQGLAAKAVAEPSDGTFRIGRGRAMHDFIAEPALHFGRRLAEQRLRRPVGAADPLLAIEQEDRVPHGIERDLPLPRGVARRLLGRLAKRRRRWRRASGWFLGHVTNSGAGTAETDQRGRAFPRASPGRCAPRGSAPRVKSCSTIWISPVCERALITGIISHSPWRRGRGMELGNRSAAQGSMPIRALPPTRKGVVDSAT